MHQNCSCMLSEPVIFLQSLSTSLIRFLKGLKVEPYFRVLWRRNFECGVGVQGLIAIYSSLPAGHILSAFHSVNGHESTQHKSPNMGFIANNGFYYVTDNDPSLHCRKLLGAGGHGSVHEVSPPLYRGLSLRSTIMMSRW
jgi:hypothetical protein